jgi:hypothetical protein
MKSAFLVALTIAAATLLAAEPDVPLGPVTIKLTNNEIATGVLLDKNADFVELRTEKGSQKIDCKQIKEIAAATGRATAAPAGKKDEPAANDVDDSELRIAAAKSVSDKAKTIDPQAQSVLQKLKADNDGLPVVPAAPEPAKPKAAERVAPKGTARDGGSRFDTALELIDKRAYKSAASVLRELVSKGAQDEIAKADTAARQRFNRPLAELIVMCYFNDLCPNCKGEGVIPCEVCKGCGYTVQLIASAAPPAPAGTHKVIGNNDPNAAKDAAPVAVAHRKVSICEACRGYGFDCCPNCLATRLVIAEPTPFERDTYTNMLLTRANECLYANETTYGDTSRDVVPTYFARTEAKLRPMLEQVWLRDSANKCKSDIVRLTRAEGYMQAAIHADPTLVLRSTKDYLQEINKIHIRRSDLYGEFSERFQVYAENRTEHMIDEERLKRTFLGEGKGTSDIKDVEKLLKDE